MYYLMWGALIMLYLRDTTERQLLERVGDGRRMKKIKGVRYFGNRGRLELGW